MKAPNLKTVGRLDDPSRRLERGVAVVTGGAHGLGEATVRRFVAEGASVAIWDKHVEDVAERFVDIEDSVLPLQVDVSDEDAVAAAEETTRATLGPIQILVNDAGVAGAAEPWGISMDEWTRMMRVNLDGQFLCIRAVLPEMRKTRYGKIINISSIAALNPRNFTHPAYGASKAGALGLVASMVRPLGAEGICINAVLPGFIRTGIHDSYSQEEMAAIRADIPLDRVGRPIDVANACLFLASSESDYVSGLFLNVNGGTAVG